MNNTLELIHRNLLIGIHDALQETFFEKNKYADKVIERLLKAHRKWGSQDRAVVSEIFYNIIRWRKRLEYYMGEGVKPGNIYKLILTYLLWSKTPHKKFEEFQGIKVSDVLTKLNKGTVPTKAIEHSVPDWLADRLEKELGPKWEVEMGAMNQPASIFLRTNTLKISPRDLQRELGHEGIDTELVRSQPEALMLTEKKNVFLTSAFKEGFFEVQDAGSQEISAFLSPTPGSRVVDTCAGAGGKTLHLASLMENKGQIVALDIHPWKLAELKRRTRRAGAHNIETRLIEDTKTIKRLHDKANFVLIDAPCSGTGVLKRNPDSKWKIDEDFINRITEEQRKILQDYSKIAKPGGVIVYATCSILPSENEKQVQNFLEQNPGFELEKEKKLWPSEGYDGFYMAKIKRKA